jgi:branched-chain amino acid transport system substrate-binding protein
MPEGTDVDQSLRSRPTRRARRPVARVVLAALLVVAACTGDDEGADPTEDSTPPPAPGHHPDGTFTVATLVDGTNDPTGIGPGVVAAVDLAVADLQQAGGVLGEPVPVAVHTSLPAEPTTADDPGTTEVATDVTAALDEAQVDLVVEVLPPAAEATALPDVVDVGALVLSPTSTWPPPEGAGEGTYLRTAASGSLQAGLLGALVAEHGHQRIVVVAGDDQRTAAAVDVLRRTFEQAGGQVDDEVHLTDDGGTSVLQPLPPTDVDALVVVDADGPAEALVALASAGIDLSRLPLYAVDAPGSHLAAQVAAEGGGAAILDGLVATAARTTVPESVRTRLLEADPALTDLTAANGAYDAVVVTALAAEVAGSDDPAAIAAAVPTVLADGERCASFAECIELVESGTDLAYRGVSGALVLGADGRPTTAGVGVLTYGPDGAVADLQHAYATG